MGLNIVAHRKMSLAGFAEGWDSCYLTVRAVSEKQRKAWADEMKTMESSTEGKADRMQLLEDYASDFLERQCKEVIVGGVIMNTDEDGNTAEYKLTEADISELTSFFSFSWQQEIVSTATGANRLKAAQ